MIPNTQIIAGGVFVANLQGNMVASPLHFSEGLVRDYDGSLFAIAHQYDRFPELQKALLKKYVYWVNAGVFSDLWNAEDTCLGHYQYYADVDFLKGKCDLKSIGGATTATTCCRCC